ELALGARQLGGGQSFATDARQLGDDDLDDLPHPLRARAGGDAEVAGVTIRAEKRVDRVRTAAPFAHLLEEARARTVAERGVQHHGDVTLRITDRDARRADAELHLLEPALVHRDA